MRARAWLLAVLLAASVARAGSDVKVEDLIRAVTDDGASRSA